MGGSSSKTKSKTTTNTATTNLNLQNVDGVDILEAGGDINFTDKGAIADSFEFGSDALSTVDSIAREAIKTAASSSIEAITKADAASRSDSSEMIKEMIKTISKTAMVLGGAFFTSKLFGKGGK